MAKEKKSSLTLKQRVGYGLGDLGGCMTNVLMGVYVTRYYVNVLQIDTNVLAILLLIWNIWDSVNDPMMGAIMDKIYAKRSNPKGKFRPWLLRATPMVAITAVAFWTVPTFFEGTAMLAVLFVCKIVYEASYTMFNIPMGSLLSAMSGNDEERAQLSSARGFGSTIGNIIPMIFFPLLLEYFGDSNAVGYGIGATICAAIGGIFCFLHYAWTEEKNTNVSAVEEKKDEAKFTDILQVFAKNRAFLALCIHGITIMVMQSIGSTLGTYMYSDVLGSIGMMSMASALGMPVSIVFLAITPMIAKKIGLNKLIRVSLLAACAMFIGLFAMHMFTDVNVWVHIIWSTLATSTAQISVLMQWGMVGEAIDYNEYLTGKRSEGSIYGTFNLFRRMGTTIGNSLAVLMLGWIGYDATLAVQTAGTLTGIKVLVVLIPAVFVIGSWAAFKFVWNITPEVSEKMNEYFRGKAAGAAEQ